MQLSPYNGVNYGYFSGAIDPPNDLARAGGVAAWLLVVGIDDRHAGVRELCGIDQLARLGRVDRLERVGDKYRFHWNFTGTNTGPGGTGRPVRISGYEEWTMGAGGLITQSLGHYDSADWDRQLGKADAAKP